MSVLRWKCLKCGFENRLDAPIEKWRDFVKVAAGHICAGCAPEDGPEYNDGLDDEGYNDAEETIYGWNDLRRREVRSLMSIAESLKGLLQEFQRPAEEQLAEVRQCPVCGGEFVPTQKDQEYCDEECKNDQEP